MKIKILLFSFSVAIFIMLAFVGVCYLFYICLPTMRIPLALIAGIPFMAISIFLIEQAVNFNFKRWAKS